MSRKSVIFLKKRDPLKGRTREETINEFCNRLSGRVERAYFFGSFALDQMTEHSDIDVIIVKNTELPFLMRVREFDDLWNIIPALDLLVYTPDEFASLIEDPGPGFWLTVKNTMVRFI